ncbi:MAG: molybdopterin-dependent oxidoreductase [Bryobacteraceae bacterium]
MTQVRHSVCALDCPDTCALRVTLEDGRGVKLAGDPEHPVTRGFLCAKVTRYLEREYSPSRLLYPMRRVGLKGEGRFERITWDAALDEIAERLGALPPDSVLPYSYAGTMGLLNGSSMDRRFFHRLGAIRLDRTICSSAGVAGLTEAQGLRYGIPPEQFSEAKLIIAWGANILGTSVHLWPFIVEARRRGARFYTIDPRRNRTGAAADRHYFVNPGSDAALAFGMMHVIIRERLYDADYVARCKGFDELRERAAAWTPEWAAAMTGLAREEIVALAREYAGARPAAIRANYGVARGERGGMAVRAIALLPMLTGAWKHAGGGMLLSTSQSFYLNRESLERPGLQPGPVRSINMAQLGSALEQGGVRALVVYNSNPAAIAPNQNAVLRGLAREDLFTVVIEQFQTDTADYADIVLPATTFLEHTDLYLAYGHYYLQLARPVLPAPGEARPNVEIFRQLAARMGFGEPCFRESEDEMIRGALASGHPTLEGITLERLERERFVRLNIPEPFLPFAEAGFDFKAETLQYEPPVESRLGDEQLRANYPLELISPKSDGGLNSTFGREAEAETARLHIHADDAAARGIVNGDTVRIFNGRGSCLARASVDANVRRGVVSAPSVRWAKCAPGGRTVNALISERLTDLGGGPVFYSCLVEVEKVEG